MKNKLQMGFTLVETLMVILIVGLLASIVVPVYNGERTKAFDTKASSNMRNSLTAVLSNQTPDGRFPSCGDIVGSEKGLPLDIGRGFQKDRLSVDCSEDLVKVRTQSKSGKKFACNVYASGEQYCLDSSNIPDDTSVVSENEGGPVDRYFNYVSNPGFEGAGSQSGSGWLYKSSFWSGNVCTSYGKGCPGASGTNYSLATDPERSGKVLDVTTSELQPFNSTKGYDMFYITNAGFSESRKYIKTGARQWAGIKVKLVAGAGNVAASVQCRWNKDDGQGGQVYLSEKDVGFQKLVKGQWIETAGLCDKTPDGAVSTSFGFRIYSDASQAQKIRFQLDDAMNIVNPQTQPVAYFDGDYPNAKWEGEKYVSPSSAWAW